MTDTGVVITPDDEIGGPSGIIGGFTEGQLANVEGAPFGPAPIYREGHEVHLFLNLSPEKRAEVQQLLVDAGVLSIDEVPIPGVWDLNSQKAMADVMALANAGGLSWSAALSRIGQQFQERGQRFDGRGTGLPSVVLSDPAAIGEVVDQSAQSVLGRSLDPEARQRIVQSLQAQEQTFRSGVASGQGGTFTSPDFGAQAEMLVRDENPVEADANEVLDIYAELSDVISTPGLF